MRWSARYVSVACLVAAAAGALGAQATRPARPINPTPATQEGSSTTRPATAPSAAPVADTGPSTQPGTALPLPDADAIIARLSSTDWRERRDAKEVLVRLGEEGKPFIQDLVRRAPTEEAKHQAQAALARIEENRVLGPSLVTLHVKNAGPAEVFEQIAKQCFAPLQTLPENLWDQGNYPKLTLDVDRKPFWEVMPQVCQKFNVDLRAYQTSMRLMRGAGNVAQGMSHVDGAFLVVANNLYYSRTRQLGAARGEQSNFGMNLTVFPEPKITLLRGNGVVKLLEAVDDHGNSLLPPGAARGVNAASFGGVAGTSINVPLSYPKAHAGTRMVRFRATTTFTVQTKVQQLQVPDVLHMRDFNASVRSTHIVFRDLRKKDENTYELRVGVGQPNFGSPEWRDVYDQAQNRLKLLDARGGEFDHRGMSTSANGNALELVLLFASSTPGRVPDRLSWDVPTESKELIVPINFDDIPMFEDN